MKIIGLKVLHWVVASKTQKRYVTKMDEIIVFGHYQTPNTYNKNTMKLWKK